MKSLFNPQDNSEVVSRINKLNHAAPAHWGTMNCSQMLAHCQVPFKIAFDEITVKRGLAGILFGKMAKKKLIDSDKPFDKNLPTFKEAKIKGSRDFYKEREMLISYVQRMATDGPRSITAKPHFFFGPLTVTEWDQLHYKHTDHHLRQFGV